MKNRELSYEQKILLNKFKQYAETGRPEKPTGFTDSSAIIARLHKDIDILQHNIGHEYYRPLEPGNRIKRNLKRVARKSIAWFMKPAFDQQTVFNAKASASLLNLTVAAQNMQTNLAVMQSNLTAIEANLETYESRFDQIAVQIEEHSKRTDSLVVRLEQSETRCERLGAILHELQKSMQKIEGRLAAGVSDVNIGEMEDGNRESSVKTYYAQSGEDAIINYILWMLQIPYEEVTYLDLGANHAKELSNTYFLYTKQARGVLVEANPDLAEELSNLRIRDTVLNKCVGTKSGEFLEFYILNGDGLSTPDKEAAEEFCRVNPALRIEKSIRVETISVNDIIRQYMEGKAPVIMSIDIEGMEKEIIRSIDFTRYRPLVVITEMIDYALTLADHKNTELLELMEEQGYTEYAFTGINSIFIDRKYIERISGGKKS